MSLLCLKLFIDNINLNIVSDLGQTEEKDEEEEDESQAGEMKPSPNADTTILFVKGEGR